MKTINIPPDRIVQWMNVIRNHQHDIPTQYRVLENFWESQIKSKIWLIENIINFRQNKKFSSVYIFGGWYGILAQLISDNIPNTTIYSIDQDPHCAIIGKQLCENQSNIHFVTEKMENFSQYSNVDENSLFINTSVEHLTQNIYDTWYNNIPKGSQIILQGNNFFECPEHVRCSKTIDDFIDISKLHKIEMTGTLDCKQFNRFMVIGII
jgi:hypothetical protein